MSEPKDAICARCRRPKHASGVGSLTQWIVSCQCESNLDALKVADDKIKLCYVCGKRLGDGRAGSFTQWIFRSDICRCKRTESDMDLHEPASGALEHMEEDGDELELDTTTFPIERYQPFAVLGQGTAGIVYRCKDRLLNKSVAVKCLRNITPEQLISFQKEARALSQLKHPSVVSVIDFGSTAGGAPYMVMELVNGKSLEMLEARDGPLSEQSAITIFAKVADSLEHAHNRGIFHRDLKPSNIMLIGDDPVNCGVKVIDFGIASTVADSCGDKVNLVGTPAYMPADQALGLPYDQRSEVYTFGCVLFEALTGRPPFLGSTALETIHMHANVDAPRLSAVCDLSFSQEIEDVVARCLEKEQAKRFQRMAELRAALNQITKNDSTSYYVEDPIKKPVNAPFSLPEGSPERKPTRTFLAFGALALTFLAVSFAAYLQHSEVPVVDSKTTDSPFNSLPERIMEIGSNTALIERGKKIEGGNYYCQGASDEDFVHFLETPREISQLDISDASITQSTFKLLSQKTKLRHLLYLRLPVERPILQKIAMIKSLESVHFLTNKMDDRALSELKALPNLRWLSIAGGATFDEEAIKLISSLKSLQILALTRAKGITREGLSAICRLPSLKELDLSETKVTDHIIQPLFDTKLEAVNLSKTKVSKKAIDELTKIPSMMEIHDVENNLRRRSNGFRPEKVQVIKQEPIF